MALKNYTTNKSPEETIGEIQRILAKHGVLGVMTEYNNVGQVSSMSFRINLGQGEVTFRMPCEWQKVLKVFKQQGVVPNKKLSPYATDKQAKAYADAQIKYEQQAMRTAWRIILDWTDAQMALVEVNMVTLPQVFLPYAVGKDGRTLGEQVLSDPKFLLG